jgi:hypothetical protein
MTYNPLGSTARTGIHPMQNAYLIKTAGSTALQKLKKS